MSEWCYWRCVLSRTLTSSGCVQDVKGFSNESRVRDVG
jgi:hypothetical protein